MSYTVFALKWRPKTFADVVGQDHIVSTLTHALEKNRLAHAYLFSGPRGVGKTSTARILARALNCINGPTAKPCGTCPACLDIARGSSLDVIEIDGASNRGIDEIRTLRENVKFAPAQGKFKVYIIDEVHQITVDGFNALLKTLEEPPEFVKFIFATTNSNKVPPTILSRCQRLDFRRISVMELIKQLEKIAASEKIRIDKDVLLTIARSSDGSLRDAESILDQLVAFSKDRVSHDDVISMLGLVEQSALFELTEAIIRRDAKACLTILNTVINEGKDTAVLLNNLIEHFRNLMVAKVSRADPQLIDLPQEICDTLLKQSQSLTLEEIFNAFTVLMNGQELSKRLDSMRIPLEISLVRLAQGVVQGAPHPSAAPARPAVRPPASAGMSHVAERKPAAAHPPQPVHPKKPEQASPQASVTIDEVKERWPQLIESIGRVKMSTATFLNEGLPVELRGSVLNICLPKHCILHKESLEEKNSRQIIEEHMAQIFRSQLRLHITLCKEENPQQAPAAEQPVIKSALNLFNARLL